MWTYPSYTQTTIITRTSIKRPKTTTTTITGKRQNENKSGQKKEIEEVSLCKKGNFS